MSKDRQKLASDALRGLDNEAVKSSLVKELRKNNQGKNALVEIHLMDLRTQVQAVETLLTPLLRDNPKIFEDIINRIGRISSISVLIGSLGPLSEAAKHVAKDPNRDGGKRGGKKSGQTRSKNRKEGWEPIAKEMIIAIRQSHPEYSQDSIATDVISGWKHEMPRVQGHKAIKDLISLMEKNGEVARRVKSL